MKVIFSRKGWDSACGGKASPVFGSKEIYSIPIPCSPPSPSYSSVTPSVLSRAGFSSAGNLISTLSRCVNTYAHLDPDLDCTSLSRHSGWRHCFGQKGSAAAHLDNQNVGKGDIFLFYGWFDDELSRVPWRYAHKDRYIIWGWLQVDCVIHLKTGNIPGWLSYHPHVVHAGSFGSKNRVYIGSNHLGGSIISGWRGAGVFGKEHSCRVLTKAPGHRTRYPDKIPAWMSFSKHQQEHVWDTNSSPLALGYLRSFFV